MADHEPITGTGLGLPIARDLARAMGGELEVASLSGIGSSFVLVLPGPAGPIPAAAMAGATRAAVASETDHLRTLGPCVPGRRRGHGRLGVDDDDLPRVADRAMHERDRGRGRRSALDRPRIRRDPSPAGFRR